MNRCCFIVSAGEIDPGIPKIPENAFIIAADRGLEHLRGWNIKPDMTVGDFDSLGYVPGDGGEIVRHPPEKDDTDTMLAVREALMLGFGEIVILGGLGGRIDHSLANIQTLDYIVREGAVGYLVGGGCVITAVMNGGLRFSPEARGTVSVFAATTEAAGVYLEGLKYPLTDYTLTPFYPLGVSNEFQGCPASISVRSGVLTVVWQGDSVDKNIFERF